MTAVDAAAVRTAVDAVLDHTGTEVLDAGDGRPIRAVALALDPDEVAAAGADLVVVHRSHGAVAPDGVALLGCHDPLDHALGLDAPLTAAALGLGGHRQLEVKLATVDGPVATVRERILAALGGAEREAGASTAGHGAAPAIASGAGERVAMASAMRPAMIHAAVAAGAGLYVTGTWRPSAEEAVAETGIGVLAIGHHRSERWALTVLADRLRAALPGVDVRVPGA